jgi:Transposase DDE domain group 1
MPASQLTLSLPLVPKKAVQVDWDGGELSSDGGCLLLALVDQQLGLTRRMAAAIQDPRHPDQITHPLVALLQQRIYQIAQGHEDANDAQTLRHDPLLKVAVGRPPSADPLAGQSTCSRFENWVTAADLQQLEYLMQDLFVERCGAQPKRIVLDLDPYDDPAHGQQQGVLFNGYYDHHCYLPLLICGTVDDGPQRLIGVVLRDGKAPPTAQAVGYLQDLVTALREQYPAVEIIVRGDSGYGVPVMIAACRALDVRFCFGKAQNPVLRRLAVPVAARGAAAETLREARPLGARRPRSCRVFGEFSYQAEEWPQAERTVVKWECTYGSANPRFVVTDLAAARGWTAHQVYRFYCARGDRENRIKEFKLDLFGGRLSCQTFLANQCRLLLHGAAYLLCQALQETVRAVAPVHELAQAQAGTLRSRLLKVAARVRTRCRVIRIHLCSSFPLRELWQRVALHLVAAVT